MEKRRRLEAFLESRDLDAVWLARPNSFAWLTGGSNVVDREADVGEAAVGFDGDGLTVVTNDIEVDRIADEELPDLDESVAVETFPWHDSSLASAVASRADGDGVGADFEVPGSERIDPAALRQPLTDRDRDRYRSLGRETAAAVESVCRELRPDDTEHEVASALSVALSGYGIDAPVVLVGGADRAQRYRHYTPSETEIGEYALVSVTSQRGGLHASCTRTVAFDPPEWLERRYRVAARVETTALAATREAAAEGRTAGDVFAAIRDAYAELGHEGEWERHHQGGAAGFAGREWIATPNHDAAVEAPMAYAWNPTVRGAKSEDTVLLEDGSFDVLTATDRWPTTTVDAVGYDLELERPAVCTLDTEN